MYRLSRNLYLFLDNEIYEVFVMFHVTRIFIYSFFDSYVQNILLISLKKRHFTCLKFFSKVNIFELEKIVCRNLGTRINMLIIRDERKQDRSCIKLAFSGFFFFGGKVRLLYLAYSRLGRTIIRSKDEVPRIGL
jgi:hypothetical protein